MSANRERRNLLVLAAATLVPFFLLAVWARYWSPAPWEPHVMLAIAAQPGLFGAAVEILNAAGNLPVWAVLIGVAAVVTAMLRGPAAAFLVALSFASDLAVFGMKLLVERDRPDTAAVEQFFGLDSFSYPSGHTVRAAAFLATLVWVFAPARYRLPLAVIAATAAGAVMGFARVSLGVHWPTDVIGGTLLGIGWFAVTTAIVLPALTLERGRR